MLTLDFLARTIIFIAGIHIILRAVYFKFTPNREAFLGFYLLGNGVYLVTYLLHSIEMSMGFAFGLFAVFAMLRYRTEPIEIRDMTYLFMVIVVALISSVANLQYYEIVVVISLICLVSRFAETNFCAPKITERRITYDRVDNIHPDNERELIADLQDRLGLNVLKVEVVKVDYLTDSAQMKLFCSDEK